MKFMLKQLWYNTLQYMNYSPILVEMKDLSTSDDGPLDAPPHFSDTDAGVPCHFEKGAPLCLHEKCYIVIYSKQFMLKE